MFKLLVVLSACACLGYASEAIGRLEPKPEEFKDQEGCYIDELKAVIPFGESRTTKTGCTRITCRGTTTLYHSCGVTSGPPNCKLVSDEKKPYPDCCPRWECP